MECTVARQLLDLASRTGDVDEELAAAREHARTCAACAEVARSQRRFDDAVSFALRDVAVPGGLKERLLASVAAAPVPAAQPPVAALPGRRSRRLLKLAACVASLAIAVGAWQFIAWQRQPRPFDLEVVHAAVARFIDPQTGQIDLSQFPRFDGSFDVKALASWLESADLKGVDLDGRQGDDGAATLIQLGRDPSSVAVLLMIPAERLSDPPALASRAAVSYAPVAHAVMRDGGYVYVYCTTARHLDDLKRLVQGATV